MPLTDVLGPPGHGLCWHARFTQPPAPPAPPDPLPPLPPVSWAPQPAETNTTTNSARETRAIRLISSPPSRRNDIIVKSGLPCSPRSVGARPAGAAGTARQRHALPALG